MVSNEMRERLWLPWWLRGWSICLQGGRPGFDPWVEKIHWRRKWQPTPEFLPGESHGRRSLVGYSPRGNFLKSIFFLWKPWMNFLANPIIPNSSPYSNNSRNLVSDFKWKERKNLLWFHEYVMKLKSWVVYPIRIWAFESESWFQFLSLAVWYLTHYFTSLSFLIREIWKGIFTFQSYFD